MLTIFFRTDVQLTEDVAFLRLESPQRRLTFNRPTPGLREALRRMAGEGVDRETLHHLIQADGPSAQLQFLRHWHKLLGIGWLCHGIQLGEERLAAAVPVVDRAYRFPLPDLGAASYVLSRFSHLHAVDGEMVLESPLAKSRVHLPDSCSVALVAQLSRPCSAAELRAAAPALPGAIVNEFLQLLVAAGMVFSVDALPERQHEALRFWEFHDLLFHSRSRQGRTDQPFGGTYRFRGEADPLPVFQPPRPDWPRVSLERPDLAALQAHDPPFAQVLETRRSIRDDEPRRPLTARELGEFLFRTARSKGTFPGAEQTLSRRPYPGGGGLYELEIYLAITECEGLEPGLYHYLPQHHELEYVTAANERLDQLQWQFGTAVHILLIARHQRLAWKYESLAYALILKHVGVLQQTMYLVATAMGLAPCALGGGDSDLFAQVSGLDYYADAAVGEFALGGAPLG